MYPTMNRRIDPVIPRMIQLTLRKGTVDGRCRRAADGIWQLKNIMRAAQVVVLGEPAVAYRPFVERLAAHPELAGTELAPQAVVTTGAREEVRIRHPVAFLERPAE